MFHREIISEMGELGVLGPTIKGRDQFVSALPLCPGNGKLCHPSPLRLPALLTLSLGTQEPRASDEQGLEPHGPPPHLL